MVYFRRQPSTSLQNFIHLHQSSAELLMFVQKSKMAAAAILDYNFIMLDHPRSPFVPLTFPSNFVLIECVLFEISRFENFANWLKAKNSGSKKSCFWGVLTPKHYFLSSRPSKGPTLCGNTRFEP